MGFSPVTSVIWFNVPLWTRPPCSTNLLTRRSCIPIRHILLANLWVYNNPGHHETLICSPQGKALVKAPHVKCTKSHYKIQLLHTKSSILIGVHKTHTPMTKAFLNWNSPSARGKRRQRSSDEDRDSITNQRWKWISQFLNFSTYHSKHVSSVVSSRFNLGNRVLLYAVES